MRRSLILTVTAAVTMVLLAMLVPMAVLLRDYVLEDRLASAALEVQATETVVSGAAEDPGSVAVFLDRINQDSTTLTTVLYADGTAIGPQPGESSRVQQARTSGQARVDDVDGGAEILVPVSLGGSSASASETPVVRIFVPAPGLGSETVLWAAVAMVGLGIALLLGSLLVADRVGRSFVDPIRRLAVYTQRLGDETRPDPEPLSGPLEVRELNLTIQRLVDRIDHLLERERQAVSDLSHRLRTPITTLRLRIESLTSDDDRSRLSQDLDHLQTMVNHVVTEARRSEREGLVVGAEAVAIITERAEFWRPLAEDQRREMFLDLPAEDTFVRASAQDLAALADVLLDNVFTHTPEGAAVAIALTPSDGGGAVLIVEDAGPGFPEGVDVVRRGTSGTDSTGLGLAIANKTATESGGGLVVERSSAGGGRVVVDLGPS